jgi:hypothetical protein
MSDGRSNTQREFYCDHCHGKMLIPRDLPPTTGPCPYCGETITSPALEVPEPPVQHVVAEVRLPVHSPVPAIPVAPAPAAVVAATKPVEPVPLPPPVVPVEAPPLAAPQVTQEVEMAPAPAIPAKIQKSPPVQVQEKTVEITPVSVRESQGPNPDEPPPIPANRVRTPVILPGEMEAAPPKKAKRSSLVVPIVVMLVLFLLLAGVWACLKAFPDAFKTAPAAMNTAEQSKLKEEAYLNDGWHDDAVAVLDHFLEAETPEKKAAYVLNGQAELPAMTAFYKARKVDDSDTPALAFASYPLPESDRKRGMFMLMYDQPPQLKLRESFYPISTLELQNGLEDPDMLLSAAASASNFASEPIKVQALFKRTPDGLRLDWPTFVQTKYHLFRDFIDFPVAGHSSVFRVLVQEDVPEKGRGAQGERSYKVFDPGNVADFTRVNVPVDSDIGRALSEINWIGTKSSRMDWRTATLELGWSTEATPQLILKRFICWEFLGLGGGKTSADK